MTTGQGQTRTIIVRVADERAPAAHASGPKYFDRVLAVIEKAAVPIALAIIAILANSIGGKVERIQKASEFNLKASESVEKLAQGLMPDGGRAGTVLLRHRGAPGIAVLRTIVQLPDRAVSPAIRDAAADALIDVINSGGTEDKDQAKLAQDQVDAEIQVLKSTQNYGYLAHRAAVTILRRTCSGKNCAALLGLLYDPSQLANQGEIDRPLQLALKGDVQGLIDKLCSPARRTNCI